MLQTRPHWTLFVLIAAVAGCEKPATTGSATPPASETGVAVNERLEGTEVRSRVIELVAFRTGVDRGSINEKSRFAEDLKCDAHGKAALIQEFGEQFGVPIPENAAAELTTVGQAMTYIEQACAARDGAHASGQGGASAPEPATAESQPAQKEPEVATTPPSGADVKKTPGGVEIEEITVGTGAECKPGQTVKVFYSGTLKSNGKPFDSNVGGDPIEFPLGSLIRGWQEGIPGMKVGGKRKLTIPYQLGYGERGSPPVIPGRADLVFEIELLGVR
jgi:acyl carrier protein